MHSTRQAVVGLFTIVALVALFAIFFVLANLGTEGRYPIAIHFRSASGLHKGALVYESGVNVGVVQAASLDSTDYSVQVVLSINDKVNVPRGARFLIQAPLTGDSTVEIVPPAPGAQETAFAPFPKDHVLRGADEPVGANPTSIQDLLDQGQGEIRRVDAMLSQLQEREPRLLATMQTALDNVNDVTRTMKGSFGILADRIDAVTAQLQTTLAASGGNITDMTAQLDQTLRANRGHIDAIAASLDASARSLNQTADSVRDLAGDPRLHANLVRTTKGIADAATTLATIASDVHDVTGNPQTKAQLADTIANADAAMQKADSILGSFGGHSSVYGVDAGATPAPGSRPVPGMVAATSAHAATTPAQVRAQFGSLISSLVQLQVRVDALSPYRSGANNAPTIGREQGPNADLDAILFPHSAYSIYTGINDLGGSAQTANAALMRAAGPHWRWGGGIVDSRLGLRAVYGASRGLGVESSLYDLRHPTADEFLTLGMGDGLKVFAGERDVFHSGRRGEAGLQLQF